MLEGMATLWVTTTGSESDPIGICSPASLSRLAPKKQVDDGHRWERLYVTSLSALGESKFCENAGNKQKTARKRHA